MNVTIRVFINGELRRQDTCKFAAEGPDESFVRMAANHMALIGGPNVPHMIEFEFLDEPNINRRFLRFGTDPSLMAKPELVQPEDILLRWGGK